MIVCVDNDEEVIANKVRASVLALRLVLAVAAGLSLPAKNREKCRHTHNPDRLFACSANISCAFGCVKSIQWLSLFPSASLSHGKSDRFKCSLCIHELEPRGFHG